MKPLLKWTGGKTSELPIIKKHIPDYERYVEPFLGGGAVYFDQMANKSLVNDFNKELVSFYNMNDDQFNVFYDIIYKLDFERKKVKNLNSKNFMKYIQDNFSKWSLIAQKEYGRKLRRIKKHSIDIDDANLWNDAFCATQYYSCRNDYNMKNDDVRHIAMWFIMRELAYSGMFRYSSHGLFNVPYGGQSYDSKDLLKKIDYIKQIRIMDFYKNTEFNNMDFQMFFEKYGYFCSSDFIFLDPPYDSAFSQYNVEEDFDRTHQTRLRDCLVKTHAKFMLVVKNTEMMQELYKDVSKFNLILFDKNYMVNFKNRNDRAVKHLMVTNYK